MSRIRKMFESIAYAGMKPGSAAPSGKRLRWLGPLAGPVTRFLDGGAAPADPFYLTNRTAGQRLRVAMVIGLPALLVAIGIGMAALGYFDDPTTLPPPTPTLSPAQVAAKMLPNLDKEIRIDGNRDVEIPEVHIDNGAVTKVSGTAQNRTDRVIENAEVVFDLTNSAGSRLGAVSTHLPKLSPKGSVTFSFPVQQRNAAFALVREIK